MKLAINPAAGDVYHWEQGWKDWLRAEDRERGDTEHWEWLTKPWRVGPDVSSMLLALVDDDDVRCHGLMLVIWPHDSRLAPGRSCVYVDHLEVAPWNRTDCATPREYEGIGTLLMAQAVMASEDVALEGRVGLCSLRQAEGFYRRIGLVGQGVGDGQDRTMAYFEFSAEAAARFVNQIMKRE